MDTFPEAQPAGTDPLSQFSSIMFGVAFGGRAKGWACSRGF
jgi:hypothetical protein